MSWMPKSSYESRASLLAGLAIRSVLIDCPLGAYRVEVRRCGGMGDCVSTCPVNVFERGRDGQCEVVNDSLCFGCMACVAQCLDRGVAVIPRKVEEHVTLEELLR
jgi:NAD-dependent dihydropyrimidine dehydrogenase PreA subunit